MPYTLDSKYENVAYTARFAAPVLELWGAGATVAQGMYDAYLPFNVPLSNFQIGGSASNAAEPIMTVKLGDVGTSRFAFDRTESSFANFSEEAFQTIPRLLAASTDWLRKSVKDFKVSTHHFLYSNHSLLKGATLTDFLSSVNARKFKNAGEPTGNGAIFNHVLRDVGWHTQLMLDRSLSVNDGLFFSFGITLSSDKIDYEGMFLAGRKYLDGMLADLGLQLSDPSQDGGTQKRK
jgi:hypothetical protein